MTKIYRLVELILPSQNLNGLTIFIKLIIQMKTIVYPFLCLYTNLCLAQSTYDSLQSPQTTHSSKIIKAAIILDTISLEPPKLFPPVTSPVIEEPEKNFKVAYQAPEFPDGEAAMLKFFYDNIRYPNFAIDQDVQGIVKVKFVVEKDGSITDAEIIQDIGVGCGAEALRVVHKMPKWNPGKQRGEFIRYQYELPIVFSLK